VPHRAEHQPASQPLNAAEAHSLARTLSLFGTPSRLRLLWALVERERTVDELATAAELSQSAASHQLRVLRDARLVKVRRSGRHAFYRLYDHHVPELLAAVRHHHEHVDPPRPDVLPAATAETPTGT
jgi:DNA-binding transcriptional ArsR family regulator